MDFDACLAAVRADISHVLAMELDSTHDEVPLTQFGMDSLTVVEIASRLSHRHGLPIRPTTLIEARTIRDLAERVKSADGSGQ